MGALDSKTRVIDVVMTPNGRASLARGGLNVAYATFTDGQTYYDPGSISGSYDTAADRIFLEAPSSLPQDTLTQITDDTGKLLPVDAFGTYASSDGTVYYSGSLRITGYQTGSVFSSAVTNVTNMFQTAYEYNSFISTRPPLDDDLEFTIVPNNTSFSIPSDLTDSSISEIDTVDSLFFDKRFANLPQFKFLPPVVSSGDTVAPLGQFRNIKKFNQYTYNDLKTEVLGTDTDPIKPRRDIDITSTTLENDLVIQMHEVTNNGVTKLDIVDYGEVVDYTDRDHQQKRILFFGKVLLDNSETATYVNLFTVVID